MRLLLDEHVGRPAAELRARGHDAVAVSENAELVGMGDDQLLEWATRERRVLVTYDHRIERLLRERSQRGETFYGVVFVPARSLPPDRSGLGPLIKALDDYLRTHPADDALVDSWSWLSAE